MKLPAAVLLVPAAILLWAQTTAVEMTSEPHHHLALENRYVRAFKVEVPPHQATLMHHHGHDYIFVSLGAAEIENDVEGKPAQRLRLQDGETHFSGGGFSHIARDLADTPFRNVTIEFLQDEKAHQTPPPKWDQERGVNVLQGGTQDILFVQDGVRVSDIQLQPGATIPRHHHAVPHLVAAVTDLTLKNQPEGKPATTVNLKSGDMEWVPAGVTHTTTNVSQRPARFIVLEFR